MPEGERRLIYLAIVDDNHDYIVSCFTFYLCFTLYFFSSRPPECIIIQLLSLIPFQYYNYCLVVRISYCIYNILYISIYYYMIYYTVLAIDTRSAFFFNESR